MVFKVETSGIMFKLVLCMRTSLLLIEPTLNLMLVVLVKNRYSVRDPINCVPLSRVYAEKTYTTRALPTVIILR